MAEQDAEEEEQEEEEDEVSSQYPNAAVSR